MQRIDRYAHPEKSIIYTIIRSYNPAGDLSAEKSEIKSLAAGAPALVPSPPLSSPPLARTLMVLYYTVLYSTVRRKQNKTKQNTKHACNEKKFACDPT